MADNNKKEKQEIEKKSISEEKASLNAANKSSATILKQVSPVNAQSKNKTFSSSPSSSDQYKPRTPNVSENISNSQSSKTKDNAGNSSSAAEQPIKTDQKSSDLKNAITRPNKHQTPDQSPSSVTSDNPSNNQVIVSEIGNSKFQAQTPSKDAAAAAKSRKQKIKTLKSPPAEQSRRSNVTARVAHKLMISRSNAPRHHKLKLEKSAFNDVNTPAPQRPKQPAMTQVTKLLPAAKSLKNIDEHHDRLIVALLSIIFLVCIGVLLKLASLSAQGQLQQRALDDKPKAIKRFTTKNRFSCNRSVLGIRITEAIRTAGSTDHFTVVFAMVTAKFSCFLELELSNKPKSGEIRFNVDMFKFTIDFNKTSDIEQPINALEVKNVQFRRVIVEEVTGISGDFLRELYQVLLYNEDFLGKHIMPGILFWFTQRLNEFELRNHPCFESNVNNLTKNPDDKYGS